MGDGSARLLIIGSINGARVKAEALECLLQLANVIAVATGNEIPVC